MNLFKKLTLSFLISASSIHFASAISKNNDEVQRAPARPAVKSLLQYDQEKDANAFLKPTPQFVDGYLNAIDQFLKAESKVKNNPKLEQGAFACCVYNLNEWLTNLSADTQVKRINSLFPRLREICLSSPDTSCNAAFSLLDLEEKEGVSAPFRQTYLKNYASYLMKLPLKELSESNLKKYYVFLNAYANTPGNKTESETVGISILQVTSKLLNAPQIEGILLNTYLGNFISFIYSFDSPSLHQKTMGTFLDFLKNKPKNLWTNLTWTHDYDSFNWRFIKIGMGGYFLSHKFPTDRQSKAEFSKFWTEFKTSGASKHIENNLPLLTEILTLTNGMPELGIKETIVDRDDLNKATNALLNNKKQLDDLNHFHERVSSAKARAKNGKITKKDKEDLLPITLFIDCLSSLLASPNKTQKQKAYELLLEWAQYLHSDDLKWMESAFPTMKDILDDIVEEIGVGFSEDSIELQTFAELAAKLGSESSEVYKIVHKRRSEKVTLQLPKSKDLQLSTVLFKYSEDLADLKDVTHNDWLALVTRFEKLGAKGPSTDKLLSAAKESYFANMFKMATNQTSLMLKHNIAYLKTIPDTQKEPDGTSKFYVKMSGLLFSVLNCPAGKDGGVTLFYRENVLGQKINGQNLKGDLAKRAVKDNLQDLFKRYLYELMSKDGPVLYKLCDAETQAEIHEPPHQEGFVRNIISPVFGLIKESGRCKFDPYANNVEESLRKLTRQQMLNAFSPYLTPDKYVNYIHAYIADGKKLGVQLGSSHEVLAKKWQDQYPALTLVPLNKIGDLVQELKNGRIDGVLIGESEARKIASLTIGAKAVPLEIQGEAFVIAFPKGSPLVHQTNDALKTMQVDVNKIEQKWIIK